MTSTSMSCSAIYGFLPHIDTSMISPREEEGRKGEAESIDELTRSRDANHVTSSPSAGACVLPGLGEEKRRRGATRSLRHRILFERPPQRGGRKGRKERIHSARDVQSSSATYPSSRRSNQLRRKKGRARPSRVDVRLEPVLRRRCDIAEPRPGNGERKGGGGGGGPRRA